MKTPSGVSNGETVIYPMDTNTCTMTPYCAKAGKTVKRRFKKKSAAKKYCKGRRKKGAKCSVVKCAKKKRKGHKRKR